jgi:hypothetical protein
MVPWKSHPTKGEPSSEHWYVVPDMLELNLNVADVEERDDPSAGPDVIVTTGPALLTVHEYWTAPDWFPAGSVATTENECGPFVRLE